MVNASEVRAIEEYAGKERMAEEMAYVRDLTSRGIEYVREAVERTILDTAKSGLHEGGVIVALGSSCSRDELKPLFGEFPKEHDIEFNERTYKWQSILQGKVEEHAQAAAMWNEFVINLVADLKEAGYRVDCKPREYSDYATSEEKSRSDMSIEALTEYPVHIDWRDAE